MINLGSRIFTISLSLSNHQPTNQPTNQSINQSINQPTNQSINHSINQPTNQSLILSDSASHLPFSSFPTLTPASPHEAPSFQGHPVPSTTQSSRTVGTSTVFSVISSKCCGTFQTMTNLSGSNKFAENLEPQTTSLKWMFGDFQPFPM